MRNLNDSSYPNNESLAFTLAAAAVKTVSFLDSDSEPVRGEHLYVRCVQTGGDAGDTCHWKVNPVASLGSDPDADSMWITSREAALLIPTFAQEIRFFTASAGTFRVYVEAYSYDDITNTAVT